MNDRRKPVILRTTACSPHVYPVFSGSFIYLCAQVGKTCPAAGGGKRQKQTKTPWGRRHRQSLRGESAHHKAGRSRPLRSVAHLGRSTGCLPASHIVHNVCNGRARHRFGKDRGHALADSRQKGPRVPGHQGSHGCHRLVWWRTALLLGTRATLASLSPALPTSDSVALPCEPLLRRPVATPRMLPTNPLPRPTSSPTALRAVQSWRLKPLDLAFGHRSQDVLPAPARRSSGCGPAALRSYRTRVLQRPAVATRSLPRRAAALGAHRLLAES